MKRVAAGALAAGLMAGTAVALPRDASAAETHSDCIQFDQNGNVIGLTANCSETIHGAFGPPPGPIPVVNPCNGDTGLLYVTVSDAVYHITVNGSFDAWDTGTTDGTAQFVPDDGSEPGGSGNFATWFGDEFNMNNLVQPGTFGVEIHLSNGQTATFHVASNTVFTPNGAQISFMKPQANCS